MYLHLPQYPWHMSGSLNVAPCPRTFFRPATAGRQSERMKNEVTPRGVCLWPNDPEELGLAYAASPLPRHPSFFFFYWTSHLPTSWPLLQIFFTIFSNIFHHPLLGFYSQNHLLCVSFLCGGRADMFNFNYLGKLSKAGSVCFERKHYLEPQAAGVGYPLPSLPHLPSQRFKWLALQSFSSEKTF